MAREIVERDDGLVRVLEDGRELGAGRLLPLAPDEVRPIPDRK
jgi:hypothetical protein